MKVCHSRAALRLLKYTGSRSINCLRAHLLSPQLTENPFLSNLVFLSLMDNPLVERKLLQSHLCSCLVKRTDKSHMFYEHSLTLTHSCSMMVAKHHRFEFFKQ